MSAFKDGIALVLRLREEGRAEDAGIVTALLLEGQEMLKQQKDLLGELLTAQQEQETQERRIAGLLDERGAHIVSLREKLDSHFAEQGVVLSETVQQLRGMREAELARVRKAGAANIKVTDDDVRRVWSDCTRDGKSFKATAAAMGLTEKQAAERLAALGLRSKRAYKKAGPAN